MESQRWGGRRLTVASEDRETEEKDMRWKAKDEGWKMCGAVRQEGLG